MAKGKLRREIGNIRRVADASPSVGDVLTWRGNSDVAWALTGGSGFQDRARVFHNAIQSIANSTVTQLAFNSERFDPTAMHDTAVNNSRITIAVAGVYAVGANVAWEASLVGQRRLTLLINSATVIARVQEDATAAGSMNQLVATVWEFSVNDFVETSVFQNSGVAVNIGSTAAHTPEFWIHRLS